MSFHNFVYFFQKLLCAYAFPQCLVTEEGSMPLPLCYEDCIAVRDQFCYSEWSLIEMNRKDQKYYKSRGHFTLPNCDELPKISNGIPTCSHTRVTEIDKDKIRSNNFLI